MRTVALQLVTVDLENGRRGVFVGGPLVTVEAADDACQVQDIWFSNVQDIPEHLTVAQLIELVREQCCRRSPSVQ